MASKLTNRLEALEQHAVDTFWQNVKYDIERLTIQESCRLARLIMKIRHRGKKGHEVNDFSGMTKAEYDEMVELLGRTIVEE